MSTSRKDPERIWFLEIRTSHGVLIVCSLCKSEFSELISKHQDWLRTRTKDEMIVLRGFTDNAARSTIMVTTTLGDIEGFTLYSEEVEN